MKHEKSHKNIAYEFFRYNQTQASLPYVKNPSTNQVIPLNEYYDKEIESDVYELATEGKINLKFGMRSSGRTGKGNLRLFRKFPIPLWTGEGSFLYPFAAGSRIDVYGVLPRMAQ